MALVSMSGVLRGFLRSCPADLWRGDVLQVRAPVPLCGKAKTLACHAIARFRATADAAPAKMKRDCASDLKFKGAQLTHQKNPSFMNWKLFRVQMHL